MSRDTPARATRLVVKVGSGVLADGDGLRADVIADLARQVSALLAEGREVVLVSSGAVAAGSAALGWDHRGRSIPEKQAAAAVGQIRLCETYQQHFAAAGRHVGQVLVTRVGLADRERFLNARHTLTMLIGLGAVPIVNENDTVATDEIRFGDNDELSATVVNLVAADLLIVLTDVDGFHTAPPEAGQPRPPLLDVVEKITPEIERAAGVSASGVGRGGMVTKLEAARTAARSGAATVVCNGRTPDVLLRVAAGESVGTLFLAGDRMQSRKHWLAYTARPLGRLLLDAGAARALRERGRSLLPTGVVSVDGQFGLGDLVACVDPEGREIARGLVSYGAAELDQIKGLPTGRIDEVLGYSNGDEAIRRDDLVLTADLPEDSADSDSPSKTSRQRGTDGGGSRS